MIHELLSHRKLIATLVSNELRMRYLGTFAGFMWGIISPTVMALIYWFVFSSLFYSSKVKYEGFELPYICYFLAGYAPWLLFQESVSRSLNTIWENTNYVKKILFPLHILAPIQFISSTVSHLVILIVLFIIMFHYGITISMGLLMLIPYYLMLAAFTLGICWGVSAINVFIRDMGQVVLLILNVWFWFSPIVWVLTSMPERYHQIFKLNPFLFFIDGYRYALFASQAPQTMDDRVYVYGIYLLMIVIVFLGGKRLFQRLQSHFSDVV